MAAVDEPLRQQAHAVDARAERREPPEEAAAGDAAEQAAWRAYLMDGRLQAQLALGAGADRNTLLEVLGRYSSPTPGLDIAPFWSVRSALVQIEAPALLSYQRVHVAGHPPAEPPERGGVAAPNS